MANEFSTAGIQLGYAVEATSGTRPTSGYTNIPGIKSMPEFNPEPSSLEVTDLSDTVWKRYIDGLKDPGGALGFLANFTADFKTAWETMYTAAETALASNKATWFEISIPNMESFYFAGRPSDLGFGGAEVDAVAEITAYITPNQVAGFASASS